MHKRTEKSENIINIPERRLPIEPLTLKEMHGSAVRRVEHISRELRNGFEFLKGFPKSVTFFGSSVMLEENPYYAKARSLARRISAELGYSITTGGGPGIMEAANRGASDAKGKSLGLTIQLPHEQATNPYVTDTISFYYFFARKVCLSFSAEAYVFFPGGYGTLDEFFEILTLVQTNKIQKVPIVLFGEEHWKPLEDFLKNQVLAKNMIESEDISLYTISDDENKILEMIKLAPVRPGIPFHKDVKKNQDQITKDPD